ncbi:SDR family NAD(P)-dependent oxidoreductase [Thalassobacillus pellis]|uniref:SDR family NAD(P)-dependent oxidoreductase n=1 Tax=Thalassobacillus pellis TaxID=748008 RepID=UPI0019608959|nr:SDR family oxidoreductase [Thalassobacillus pellis]MBM7553452.1 NAD(P)-dependent dehydrogenase (short-subunit alcohol dehydrogenase family) [Thalassobacillus pellis]
MLKNKTALVTGGANGIGKAIVEEFARNGFSVIFIDKDKEMGQEVCRKGKEQGCQIEFKHCDVSDPIDVEKIFTEIKDDYDSIDVLVNNAGISKFKNFWEMKVTDWDEVISTNLSSIFYITKEAALMMKERGGSIINIASTRAAMSEPDTEAYSASKGGIVALTHALAMTLSENYIRVNSISPGWIQTENYDSLREKDHFQHPSKRVGKPEDIAKACMFLSKEENDFMNGENLVIDGGMTRKMIYEH